MKAQTGEVEVPESEQEQGGENSCEHMSVRDQDNTSSNQNLTFGKNVKDTIRDSLRVRRDDVAAFADTPDDRVHQPNEHEPAAAQGIVAENILADGTGIDATFPDD